MQIEVGKEYKTRDGSRALILYDAGAHVEYERWFGIRFPNKGKPEAMSWLSRGQWADIVDESNFDLILDVEEEVDKRSAWEDGFKDGAQQVFWEMIEIVDSEPDFSKLTRRLYKYAMDMGIKPK